MTDFRFPKEEKLKHKREIDLLFAKGKWQTCGNLRIISINLEKKPQEDFPEGSRVIGMLLFTLFSTTQPVLFSENQL